MNRLSWFLASLLASAVAGCGLCPDVGWLVEHPATEDPDTKHESEQVEERGRQLLGDASCAPGAPDCNVCAPDVEAQFASPDWQGHVQNWYFGAPGKSDVAPRQAYSLAHGGHAQGFVRLNAAPEAYALVHSIGTGSIASLSFVGRRAARLELETLYRLPAAEGHTSGAFVLGRYVGLIDDPRRLALIDTEAALGHEEFAVQHLLLSHRDPEARFVSDPKHHGLTDWSGGIAMAKLNGGTYLLLANEGGDSAGKSHLFELGPFAGLPQQSTLYMREIGEAKAARGSVCAEYHHSENVALITECGTGQLYSVHVGSNDKIQAKNYEPGVYRTFWRVSRVVVRGKSATLEPVGTYLRKAHLGSCHGRSAGSAFVDPETRRISLLCHERDQLSPDRGPWRFWAESVQHTPSPVTSSPGSDPLQADTAQQGDR